MGYDADAVQDAVDRTVETFGAIRWNGEREWLLMRRIGVALQSEEVGGQDA